MSNPNPQPEKYVPTPEELVGESWAYCYGQPVVLPPIPEIEDGYYTDPTRYADPQ